MLERCVSMWFVIMLLFFHIFYIWETEEELLTKFFFTKKIIMSSFDYLHEIDEIYTNLFFLLFFLRTIGWEGKRINFIFL